LQRRGKIDEANEIYSRVLKQRPGKSREVDVTVLAVACNNIVTLRSAKSKTLFDSLKRINVASTESLEHKLTRKQTVEIGANKSLLLAEAKKVDEALREIKRLRELNPGNARLAIVQAAIEYKEKNTQGCEDILRQYLETYPGTEEVLLCLSEILTKQNRTDKAVEVIVQLPLGRRAQPRSLEVVAALYQKQKSPEKAVACIREALDYWSSDEAPADEGKLAAVLRVAVRFSKQLKNADLGAYAHRLYLEKVDGSNVEALCGLVQALTTTDVERAGQYAQRLRVTSYDHLDPEALEIAEIPKLRGVGVKQREGEKEGADGAPVVKKKRCRRKIRYPKGFDPANPGPPPDPERWIPKRERTEYKKKMRKRDKALQRGPQGSMPTDDMAFRKQGPSTAQIEAAKDSTTNRRNQGRKKQGKK
jgi:signal recognition particle subunit SRP72